MLYERILKERNKIEKQLNQIQNQLQDLPDGKLYCTHSNNHFKWFLSNTPKPIYIPRKDRKFAEQLALKKYLQKLYTDLQNEKNALDFYLRHHHSDYEESEKILLHPGYKELLVPLFKPLNQELAEWSMAPYEKYDKFPEQLIHKTSSGNIVRSKSEALIDMVLYTNKIPFRYECALQLGAITMHPEFTIRHPQTGETYYWEHFGLMDKSYYRQSAISRIQTYISNQIIPSIQLIATFETHSHPLSSETIEKIVDHYFF